MRFLVVLTVVAAAAALGAEEHEAVRTDADGDPLPSKAVARLGTTRFRTTGEVYAVSASANGTYVAWGGSAGLQVCNAKGKKLFAGHSRDAEEILTVRFSPDSRFLAVGGELGHVYLYETGTWKKRLLKGHEGGIYHFAFSPDGKRLASTDDAGELILWNLSRGVAERTFAPEDLQPHAVAFAPDGKHIACGMWEGPIVLLNASTLVEQVRTAGHGDDVRDLSFSPDGRLLASCSDDMSLRVWKAETLRPVWAGEANDLVSSLLFTPDGKTILTADEEGYVRVWDTVTGQEKRRHLINSEPGMTYLYDLALSSDGKRLYCAGDTGDLALLDFQSGQRIHVCAGHRSPPLQLAFSPDSKLLASGAMDGSIRVWDVATGRQRFMRAVPTDWDTRPVFSSDSKRIAACGMEVVHIWDAQMGTPVAFGQGSSNYSNRLVSSPDGQGLMALSGNRLVLWSFEDGHRLPEPGAANNGKEGDDEEEPVDVGELHLIFDQRTLLATSETPTMTTSRSAKKRRKRFCTWACSPSPTCVRP